MAEVSVANAGDAARLPKRSVAGKERPVAKSKSASREPATLNTTAAKLNVPIERRLKLARAAAYEVMALAASMRPYIKRMQSDTYEEEVAIYALLDRLEVIGDELFDAANLEEDWDHKAKTLGVRLRAP